MPDLSRRTFLSGSVIAGAASLIHLSTQTPIDSNVVKGSTAVEPFYGEHQSGVSTAQQEHAMLIAMNLLPGVLAAETARLMRLWTTDIDLLMQGKPAMGDNEATLVGENSLTVTVGFGRSLFQKCGIDAKWPWATNADQSLSLKSSRGEWSDSDLVLQVCGDDPVRVHHAARELVSGAKPFAKVVWTQIGFLSANELRAGQTPRNLFGQKDGTANYSTESSEFRETVWNGEGYTSMVVRRISMDLDRWETLSPDLKSKVIGRNLDSGAPLGSANEFAEPDFKARDHHGLVIPADSHMRRARIEGKRLHRRGYNYQVQSSAGEVESGLIFISFQSDPEHFMAIQRKLAAMDALNKWTKALGHATYYIPAGCAHGGWLGEKVL